MTTPPGPPPPPYGAQPPYQQPYGQQPYGQPGYPPPPPMPYSGEQPHYGPPPAKSRRPLYLALGALAVLAVLVVGGVVLYLTVGSGTVTATSIGVGDCLREIPGDTRVLTVRTVDCGENHAGEVFAVLEMPAGDFPGQAAIDAYAEQCSPALAAYSPQAMTDDSVQMYVLYPTEETWAQGDRAVTCIATLDPPRAGSLRG
ncbi:septum formation family protein [Mycolicibacterium phlei]|uniref:septum formation family protein n=1 Tax=Mycolicibacterium phlei TaxID=1771 RepID=UPI000591335B|nr:septum formation family protein [Mycolicibacterium phlei]